MGEETAQQDLFSKEIRALNIVLIENNAILRRTIIRILKDAGATKVLEADSGREGTMVLKANRDIGIIICSDHLTDMDSRKFLQTLGQEKKFEATTQVLVSANTEIQSIQKAIGSGVDGYVVKPFPFPELRDKIEGAVEMRKKRLALKDLRVDMELPVQVKAGHSKFRGTCVQLARTDCQIIVEEDLGMGGRLQIRFPMVKAEKTASYEAISGSIASAGRAPNGGQLLKVNFTGKPNKSHGITTILNHFSQI